MLRTRLLRMFVVDALTEVTLAVSAIDEIAKR